MNPREFRMQEAPEEKAIAVLSNRPERETIISEDDILNLRIALNTESSLEEFIEVV